MACPQYLLISSKHRIRAEKDYNLWADFKWLRQIFQHYAMTNNFLQRMELKLMPCSQHALCVLQFMISIPPAYLVPPPTDIPFEGSEQLGYNDEISARFLLIVYLQSAPFPMLDSLICHVGAMYNKSIFSCICQLMKTPQWCVYASTEWKILNSFQKEIKIFHRCWKATVWLGARHS